MSLYKGVNTGAQNSLGALSESSYQSKDGNQNTRNRSECSEEKPGFVQIMVSFLHQ